MTRNFYKIIAIVLAIFFVFPILTVSAQETQQSINWESKISDELWAIMNESSETDFIPVYVWLDDIDRDIIDKAMLEETGMDPAVYENETRFNNEVVPMLAAQIEAQVGYEAAHASVEPQEQDFILDENGAFHDNSMSLVDRASQAKINEYTMKKRAIIKREHSTITQEFIDMYVSQEQKVISKSNYITCVILKATKNEIESYAKLSKVVELSLYAIQLQTTEMCIFPNQVDADYNGTKGTLYNSGNGFKGTGIKIGIIEAEQGKYDAECPHLADISGTRLIFANDASTADNQIYYGITEHASIVTSLVVGQPITINSTLYEGIVPLATVYQTPIKAPDNIYLAFENMADRGVSVINYSGGSQTGSTSYTEFDQYIDRLIYSTGIVFVNSAGNSGTTDTYVSSPGNALNAITVGNTETVSSTYMTLSSPYLMYSESSYNEASYLPNKPDIVAPGTMVRVVKSSENHADTFYYENNITEAAGTSYAAPIVTGIIAQIQQARPAALTNNPGLVKAILLAGAKPNKIKNASTTYSGYRDTTNSSEEESPWIWEKSGAGMANAVNAVNIALADTYGYSYFPDDSVSAVTPAQYFTAGQTVRAVLFFEKSLDTTITSSSQLEDIDLYLVNAYEEIYISSYSSINNVEIIEYTITESGYYSLQLTPYRVLNGRLYYYYAWMAY